MPLLVQARTKQTSKRNRSGPGARDIPTRPCKGEPNYAVSRRRRGAAHGWEQHVAAALVKDYDWQGDGELSSRNYIQEPVIFWSKSSKSEKYKFWLWDGKIARADFDAQRNECTANHGANTRKWPEEAQQMLSEMTLFNPKFFNNNYPDGKQFCTENLSYLKDCAYGCADVVLKEIEMDGRNHWALILINDSGQFFGLDLLGVHAVTAKSYVCGLADFFLHEHEKFCPKPKKNPEYHTQLLYYFGRKHLVGDGSLLMSALQTFQGQITVQNKVFPIMEKFLLKPQLLDSKAMTKAWSQLSSVEGNSVFMAFVFVRSLLLSHLHSYSRVIVSIVSFQVIAFSVRKRAPRTPMT